MDHADLVIPGGLCFIRCDYAFFTTKKVTDQYGEDWRKIYNEDSGLPDDSTGYLVSRVQFDYGLLRNPYTAVNRPDLSVTDLNKGMAPWLSTRYGELPTAANPIVDVNIFAGCDILQFQTALEQAQGTILVPLTRCRFAPVNVRTK